MTSWFIVHSAEAHGKSLNTLASEALEKSVTAVEGSLHSHGPETVHGMR